MLMREFPCKLGIALKDESTLFKLTHAITIILLEKTAIIAWQLNILNLYFSYLPLV